MGVEYTLLQVRETSIPWTKGELGIKLTTCFLTLLTVHPCDFNSSEKNNTCQTVFHTTDRKSKKKKEPFVANF